MTLPTPILVPLAEIDPDALARDRTALDPEALSELESSIAVSGLRQPIEIFEIRPAEGEPVNHWSKTRYGVLSGFRRFHAMRRLHEATGQERYAAIPAFVRAPASVAAALAAMVEENEIRADLSPYERGLIAVTARDRGVFGSVEEAVNGLFPNPHFSPRVGASGS